MEENRKASLTGKDKIRVGIVNYLNTKPLLYGLTRNDIKNDILLHGDYPSRLAEMLKDDEIDIGLIPVAVIPELPVSFVAGDYCIAAEGEIASVALFSEVPMNEITKVYLDYQSKSSVALLKYLMHESWGIHPELVYASDESYRELIKGTTAGLVIGDRAFEQRKISTFIYDLGSEWRSISGLPFVFAAWVSNKKLPEDFIARFNEANALGLKHINEIVSETSFPLYDLQKYYKIHLSYQLDERKKMGMSRFLELIGHQSASKFVEVPRVDLH
ncbi:MAG TPA: menaquinone biosynthesis protein [Chitinophagaceae bacterium]|nr:menaquinone biosynthesis protein [Chitinophagaceae bacterium]